MKTTLFRVDAPDRNGDCYPEAVLREAIAKAKLPLVGFKFAGRNQPVSLDTAEFLVTDLVVEAPDVVGKITLLNPNSEVARALEAGSMVPRLACHAYANNGVAYSCKVQYAVFMPTDQDPLAP